MFDLTDHIFLLVQLSRAQTLLSRVLEHSERCVLWQAVTFQLYSRGGGISVVLDDTIVFLTLKC